MTTEQQKAFEDRLIEELNARIVRFQREPYYGQTVVALIQVRDAVEAASKDVKPCDNGGSPDHGIEGCQKAFNPQIHRSIFPGTAKEE